MKTFVNIVGWILFVAVLVSLIKWAAEEPIDNKDQNKTYLHWQGK